MYKLNKRYDYLVFSQSWDLYDNDIINVSPDVSNSKFSLEKWKVFIDKTIEHFKPLAQNIIIIGEHPKVEGVKALQPTIFLTQKSYQSKLDELQVQNMDDLNESEKFFEQWQLQDDVSVIYPKNIWCPRECKLHDGLWSFFIDKKHISGASTDYVIEKLNDQLDSI